MNDPGPIHDDVLPLKGAADARGRLVAADEGLYALQAAAGARLGEAIAVPQLAAVVREAIQRRRPLRRAIIAASVNEDLELRVHVAPDEEGGVEITVEDWRATPRGEARFTTIRSADWEVDLRVRMVAIDPDLARRWDVDATTLPRPMTDVLTLKPASDGSLALIDALSSGKTFDVQDAVLKRTGRAVAFAGTPVTGAEEGEITGFALKLLEDEGALSDQEDGIDATLRSPLDRIITAADQIVDRSDGPLRSDYANYAGDIATAGRHLLSVIRSMSGIVEGKGATDAVDLAALAQEAASMVSAEARRAGVEVTIEETDGAIRARGEMRAILQILVNIAGNAIRHSPEGGVVALSFEETDAHVAVTIADEGPGIARADQVRIFDEYERLGPEDQNHAGLGLAISRRLARSMRGDIMLDSVEGDGARFTLKLPRA
ncbi:HAMP domain-containing sensor histidine kinase [Sphingomicrobium sp. XHP0239]|uniref:sensor histidine kinase n=1 Tax=Sphingomicrobium maritimum TaxID=3133972 RepID=UPI0031CCC1AF